MENAALAIAAFSAITALSAASGASGGVERAAVTTPGAGSAGRDAGTRAPPSAGSVASGVFSGGRYLEWNEKASCDMGRERVDFDSGGKARWSSDREKETRFEVPVDSPGAMSRVWCLAAADSLLLVYQVTVAGGGRGYAARIVRNGTVAWKTTIPQFNVGEPWLDGSDLYVSAVGFLAKIDATSGRYVWKDADLYRDPGMYTAFGRPTRNGTRIVFPAIHSPTPQTESWPKTIELDSSTGKVLAGAPPPR